MPIEFNLPEGQSANIPLRQIVTTLPAQPAGTEYFFYFLSCISYQDGYGGNHETCDNFQLTFPSENPLDKNFGVLMFPCDNQPHIGKLVLAFNGHCER